MKKSTKSMIAVAAVAGLFSGSLAVQAHAAKVNGTDAGKTIRQMEADKSSCSGKDGCKGKHDCKGKNSCKGQGGCQSGDNGCKGKNSCKGKGGCNTNKPM
jgi:hypothetical protein